MTRTVLAALFVVVLSGSARAATVPYANDFSGVGSNVDFDLGGNGGTEAFTGSTTSPNISGGWTTGSGVYNLDIKNTPNGSGGSNISTAAISLTNVTTSDWIMQTQFKVNSGTSSAVAGRGLSIGFGALGSTATFSSSSTNKDYLADMS